MLRLAIAAAALSVLLVACDGDEEASTPTAAPGQTSGPVPTATPFARVPEPIIVTGDGTLPSGGGGGSEDAVTYVVESGDTVGAIAARFGVPEDVIREANDLVDDEIFIGQTLTIPRGDGDGGTGGEATAEPTQAPGGGGGGGTYTVQDGDTAFGIALQFDVTVEELEAANGVGPGGLDDLQIGQVIQLP